MKMILTILLLVVSNIGLAQEKEVIVSAPWAKIKNVDSWQLTYAVYGMPRDGMGDLRGVATAVFPRSFNTKLDCTTTAPGLMGIAKLRGYKAHLVWTCIPIYKNVVENKSTLTKEPRKN